MTDGLAHHQTACLLLRTLQPTLLFVAGGGTFQEESIEDLAASETVMTDSLAQQQTKQHVHTFKPSQHSLAPQHHKQHVHTFILSQH